jgi:hypothetical protein
VTYLRDSDFGGVGPYAEVDETMTLAALGGSAALRYQNLRKVAQAMDEATRWAKGQTVTVVTLAYAPDGAGAGTVSTVILGRPRGGENPFGLSSWYGAAAGAIPDNALRFRRRGLWLSSFEESGTAVVPTYRWASHPIPSPVKVTLTGVSNLGTGTAEAQYGYLFWTSGFSALDTLAAASGTLGTPIAVVTDVSSTFGSIARMAPSALTAGTITYNTSLFVSEMLVGRIHHLYLHTRQSSNAGPTFSVQARATLTSGVTVDGPVTYLPGPAGYGSAVVPVHIGTLPSGGALASLRLVLTASATSSATLDLDSLVIVTENDEYARILPVSIAAGAGTALVVDHRYLTHMEPVVQVSSATATAGITYHGNPFWLESGGTARLKWLASAGGTAWTNGAPTVTLARRRGFYLPE